MTSPPSSPSAPGTGTPAGPELTRRGLALGAAIVAVFMASNLYLGLRTGVTFSTSIPAALLSMGCLRLVGGRVRENNIVQTEASAAGTLSNVILVLPGLVLTGQWHGFPFWQTTAVCAAGGLLGIAFSVPLRRALVAEGGLPFPEGTAAAEVLRAGHEEEGQTGRGLTELLAAGGISAVVAFATGGLRLLGEGATAAIGVGGALVRVGTGFSLALVGAGYLIGIGASLAILAGIVLAWGVGVPLLTAMGAGAGQPMEVAARAVWSGQVRLAGAGIMAVGGVWTVGQLLPAIGHSLRGLVRRDGQGGEDLPAWVIVAAVVGCAAVVAGLLLSFTGLDGLGRATLPVVAAATLFTLVAGFLLSAACGYLAGLVGSSTSPISGMGVLAVLAASLPLSALAGDGESRTLLVGLVLLVASVVVTACAIANDNLQDLKTGQLVGATPWRQQVALVVGVAVGAPLIAPVLGLLYRAYGFAGALPRPGMDEAAALPAPQATLLAGIARGVVGGGLPWGPIAAGVAVGVVLVAAERWARRRGLSFPVLSVGIGVYLPLEAVTPIVIGGMLAWLAARLARRQPGHEEPARQRGVRLASGLLVGESLAGLLVAAADAAWGHAAPLALGVPGPVATVLGALVFGVACAGLVRLASRPAGL